MTNKLGRPKKSIDTERACPTCGTRFTVPQWNPKRFCSQTCARASSKGIPRPVGSGRIEKTCPGCGENFIVYKSQDYVACCSRKCSTVYRRQQAGTMVRQMSDVEIAWFAGLFDGEGSIVRSRNGTTGHFKIVIYNTMLPLLEQVKKFTGVGVIRMRESKNPRHSDCYYWYVGAAEALEILRQVRPWLIVKADRADAVLEGKSFDRQSRWDNIYPEGID